jgi:hypothetical protein
MVETHRPARGGIETGQANESPDVEESASTAPRPWYSTGRGIVVVVLFGVLAVIGGLIATGMVLPGVVFWDQAFYERPENQLAIPPHIYLYAYLGAVTYAFTTLVVNPDTETKALVQIGARIPAALLLVTGVYLLGSWLEVIPKEPREIAGIAFLVGLFVKHALKGLTAISARLYPGNPSDLYEERGGRRSA